MRGLAGKCVLVTGGGQGIGRAICERLGAEGARVGVLDQDADLANDAVASIVSAGGTASALAADITDAAAVAAALASLQAAHGPIGGLVNNAGWDKAVPFVQTDEALRRRIVDINLFGPLHVTHACLGAMVEAGAGRVVSIASDAARVGSSGEAVYSACKGGVVALMKTLAREHARQGITFNSVCPGPTDTSLLASFDDTGRLTAALEKAIPMRRLGQPDDYPGIVAFLLSDDAAFITGQTISVSGGLTMHG